MFSSTSRLRGLILKGHNSTHKMKKGTKFNRTMSQNRVKGSVIIHSASKIQHLSNEVQFNQARNLKRGQKKFRELIICSHSNLAKGENNKLLKGLHKAFKALLTTDKTQALIEDLLSKA